jgi:hypothetical protein
MPVDHLFIHCNSNLKGQRTASAFRKATDQSREKNQKEQFEVSKRQLTWNFARWQVGRK